MTPAASEEFLGTSVGPAAPAGGGGDEVRDEDGRATARRETGIRAPGRRRQPAAARDGLHRPLPVAPARSRYADRRHARRDGGAGACGQSTGDRLLELLRGTATGRARAIRERTEPLQPLPSRTRGFRHSGVRPSGTRVHSLLPAGERPSDRKVPRRASRRPRAVAETRDSARRSLRRKISSGWSGSASSPGTAAIPCSNWRCHGSRISPP